MLTEYANEIMKQGKRLRIKKLPCRPRYTQLLTVAYFQAALINCNDWNEKGEDIFSIHFSTDRYIADILLLFIV